MWQLREVVGRLFGAGFVCKQGPKSAWVEGERRPALRAAPRTTETPGLPHEYPPP